MIRRTLVTSVALTATAALLLTGCGRTDAGSDGAAEADTISDGPATGTVTIWAQGTEGEALQDFVAPFEEANPDVTVRVTAVPWDSAQNKYQTAVAGGTTPDIGMLGSDWMPGFATALAPTPDAVDTSGMFPVSVETTDLGGTHYGVPWYVETRVIFDRSDLVKEAGFEEFPEDWAGFKELAGALKANGAEYAINLPSGGWNGYLNMLPFALSNGASVTSPGLDEWTFDTPEMAEGLAYVDSFFDEGLADATPNAEAASTASQLVDGSVPMFVSGPWDIPGLKNAGGEGFEDKFDVARIPAGPGSESTSIAAGANLAVFKTAENPDAAWKLIQWLTQPEVQVEWFKAVNGLPSQQAAWDDSALSDDPKVATFGAQLESVQALPPVDSWTQISAAADTEWEQVVRGTVDPAEALATIQSTADGLGFGR